MENRPPYELLGVTLEERFEVVDLEPEIVTTRTPRIIEKPGLIDRGGVLYERVTS